MSSGSESDDDYVPGAPEQLSEEESADDETEQQYEKEQEQKAIKRNLKSEKVTNKKRKLRKDVIEEVQEPEDNKELAAPTNPEDEKKYEEDLWAKFLEGTDTKPKGKANEVSTSKPVQQTEINTTKTPAKVDDDDDKSREKRIFEFAGETIVVENNEIKERLPAKSDEDSSEGTKTQDIPVRSRKSGLAGLVGQLNKKNTLSTLEKSKLDWNTYKKQEGVEDEIRSINKGKKGYLDRQDFLERADQRQYEIERELRMSRRSNR